MEAFIIIVIITIFVIMIINSVSRANKLNDILNKINSVENKLNRIDDKIQQMKVPSPVTQQEKPIITPPKISTAPVIPEPKKETVKEVYIHPEVIEPPKQMPEKFQHVVQPPVPKHSWWDKWVLENPDIEKFIGENLANKIGIAVLVLGIGFFVKYAIDKDWVNEAGRVSTGLLCGAALIALAHRLKNKYRSFSSVLVGGGLAVLYFTTALAFHQYHMFSQTAAFIIMIVITVFAVTLSLLYNRIELSVLATLGGYAAPFLVSTGQNNYTALFVYIAILNTGLLALSYFKKWNLVHYIALFFTVIIYGGWLVNQAVNYDIMPYRAALLFASLFYFQFVAMAVINKLRTGELFDKFNFSLLLGINVLFFSAGMFILSDFHDGDYKGLFTIILATVNLILAWSFFKRFKADKNFIYLLIGLTLTYISLAAPVQLKGNYITLFWAAETVLLFWLYQRSGISLMKIGSLIVFAALIISLAMDWEQLYLHASDQRMIIFNKAYLTSFFVSAALFVYYRLLYKEADSFFLNGLSNKLLRNILLSTGILVLYLSGLFEMNYQFRSHTLQADLFVPYSFLYTAAFSVITILLLTGIKKNNLLLQSLVTAFVFAFYCSGIADTKAMFISDIISSKSVLPVAAHWAAVVLLFWLMYKSIQSIRKNYSGQTLVAATYILAGAYLLVISFSLLYPWLFINHTVENNFSFYNNLYEKAVLTISWALSSFIMMWMGLKNSFKPLRWCSIILFAVTLVKLFLYDIRNIPAGGKIAAFILLGILLLIISFMYLSLIHI
ncbi:MAG: DUF2339 domain-containing protein, partial [Lacibacter sp.]